MKRLFGKSYTDSGFVCTKPDGTPLHPNFVTHHFHLVLTQHRQRRPEPFRLFRAGSRHCRGQSGQSHPAPGRYQGRCLQGGGQRIEPRCGCRTDRCQAAGDKRVHHQPERISGPHQEHQPLCPGIEWRHLCGARLPGERDSADEVQHPRQRQRSGSHTGQKVWFGVNAGPGLFCADGRTPRHDAVTPEKATVADVVDDVGQVDAAMTVVGTVPDLICAPGWSHNTVVAAVMATKASAISGLFKGKAVIDADSSEDGVTEYSQLMGWRLFADGKAPNAERQLAGTQDPGDEGGGGDGHTRNLPKHAGVGMV